MRLRLNGNAEDYRRMIASGEAQLHKFNSGFAITRVVAYKHPDERVLNVLLIGGREFDSWKADADAKFDEFARVNGCNAVEFACRTGLEPRLRKLGYRRHRILMRKELECGKLENSAVPA